MAKKGTIMCGECTKVNCRRDFPGGVPAWCATAQFEDVIDQTKEQYSAPESLGLYLAAGTVATRGHGKWTRVQEAIEFAKELKLKKIGFASCVSLIKELGMVVELFSGAGFAVVSAGCQIGRVSPEARGLRGDFAEMHSMYCNPIAQAEILNQEGTELNFVLGLCLGHDILFMRHSKAPASTLIVKDRITGNNPAAALYASSLRRPLWKQYCNQDVD